MNIAMVEDF